MKLRGHLIEAAISDLILFNTNDDCGSKNQEKENRSGSKNQEKEKPSDSNNSYFVVFENIPGRVSMLLENISANETIKLPANPWIERLVAENKGYARQLLQELNLSCNFFTFDTADTKIDCYAASIIHAFCTI